MICIGKNLKIKCCLLILVNIAATESSSVEDPNHPELPSLGSEDLAELDPTNSFGVNRSRRAGKRRLRHLSCPDYREFKVPRWSSRRKNDCSDKAEKQSQNEMAAEALVELSKAVTESAATGMTTVTATITPISSLMAVSSAPSTATVESEILQKTEEVDILSSSRSDVSDVSSTSLRSSRSSTPSASSSDSAPPSPSPNPSPSPSPVKVPNPSYKQQTSTASFSAPSYIPLDSSETVTTQASPSNPYGSVTWDQEVARQLQFIRRQQEMSSTDGKLTVKVDKYGRRSVTTVIRDQPCTFTERQQRSQDYTSTPSSSVFTSYRPQPSTAPLPTTRPGTPPPPRIWDVLPPTLQPSVWSQTFDAFLQGPRIRTLVGGGRVYQAEMPNQTPNGSSGRGSAASNQPTTLEERLDRIDRVMSRILDRLNVQ